MLDKSISRETRAGVFKELFLAHQSLGNKMLAFCFGEAAIREAPLDDDFRFKLAYQYTDERGASGVRDSIDLAVFHYQKLCERDGTHAAAINNLGWSYMQAEIPIHGTKHYKAAAELGHPRGVANVIHQYGSIGLFDEAKMLFQEHVGKDDIEGSISSAFASLSSSEKAEREKINQLLNFQSEIRTFLADAALASLETLESPLEGDWRFPKFTIDFVKSNATIEGSGTRRVGGDETTYKLHGRLRGRLAEFTMTEKGGGLFASLTDPHTRRGLIIFDCDAQVGRVLEFADPPGPAPYQIFRAMG